MAKSSVKFIKFRKVHLGRRRVRVAMRARACVCAHALQRGRREENISGARERAGQTPPPLPPLREEQAQERM